MNKENKAYPMHVVLLEEGQFMRSVWLPAEKEGRYVFEADVVGNTVPISIVADKGEWYAIAGKNGQFILNGEIVGKRVLLKDCAMIMVAFGDRRYTLYSEFEHEKDNVFLPYYIEKHTDIHIGRLANCDICYPNPFISRDHAMLHWENNNWYIVDLGSKNGVFLNGVSIKNSRVETGDVIYIMGMYIIIGAGYIGINNANNRVQLTTPRIRPINNENDIEYFSYTSKGQEELFDRRPRKKFKVDKKEIEFEMPPMPMSANKTPLLLRMGNPLLMGGQAILTGNVLSAMTSLVLPTLTQGMTEKDRKEYEAMRDEKYHEYLDYLSQKIKNEISDEQKLLTEVYPQISDILRFSYDKSRLWERRKFDEDFLDVRIGSGKIPMIATKKYPPKKFELERDSLVDEMYKVAEAPAFLNNAPILLSLKKDYVTSIIGEHQQAIKLIYNIIVQLALTHAYDEMKIVILCDQKDEKEFEFVKYLPHNWDNEHNIRFFATSRSDAQQLSKFFNDELEGLFDNGYSSNRKETMKTKPSYIVFAIDKELYESIEILKKVVQFEEYSLMSVVTAFDGAPKESSKLISLKNENFLIDLVNPEIEDQAFNFDDTEKDKVLDSMQQLMKTKLRIDVESQFALPNMISFLEMYRAGKVEHLNPLKRWVDNNPVKSLAAPLGVGTDGKLFTLDLHEKKQGPHGLVAGGTGSGKSEFIITYILSMAVNFSPDEVAFILIDYKGGGLADAFVDEKRGIHLPHVVGTITNLDGAAIHRSLMSINSELKRRQAVFKKAKSETNEGTMDIYDYQKLYRNGKVSEPMPHLFIISDEFAELKKQQPEFMDELISTARIGRSLGVHLILATQKPSGVVNDQIWSNTKFRICLRVADKSDSMEMLKRPEAAEIKNTGRFYLQVGYNELFAMGQSAWCGAGYVPQEEVFIEEDKTVQFIDNVGQVVLNAKPKPKTELKAQGKQIVAIVQYLSDLAKRENIIPKRLWCDPLPEYIDYEELEKDRTIDNNKIEALIGVADDPEHQSQFPFTIDMQSFHHMLLCGVSGSGKSTLLSTMLYSLINNYSPDDINYYILDMSGGALVNFSKAPHCGVYLTENNEADFDRLLAMLKEIVAERKKLFADAEVTNFESYRKIKKLPLILFIMDNYTNINNFRRGPAYYADMGDYMKECAAYGIRFIISVNHLNEVHSKSRQEIDYRIALQGKDKYDYSDILDFRTNLSTPQVKGRGACIIDSKPYEFHASMLAAKLSEQERTQKLKDRIESVSNSYQVSNFIKKLPMVDGDETYDAFCNKFANERIPLGYSLKDMKPVAIPLKQLHSMSLYFGNTDGIKPVFKNIIRASEFNKMDVLIVKKSYDSIFDTDEVADYVEQYFSGKISFLESTQDGMDALKDIFMQELAERNVYRDKYCEANNIPRTLKDRVRKAEKYIRANTKPLLIVFESFGDICRLERTEVITDIEGAFQVFFERTKGYNIYFAAGFYPDDKDINLSAFKQSYNKPEFSLLFGGRYDKQCVIDSLPMDYRILDKVNPKYDRFLLKYRDEFFSMRMPCGELTVAEIDPDDAPIV